MAIPQSWLRLTIANGDNEILPEQRTLHLISRSDVTSEFLTVAGIEEKDYTNEVEVKSTDGNMVMILSKRLNEEAISDGMVTHHSSCSVLFCLVMNTQSSELN